MIQEQPVWYGIEMLTMYLSISEGVFANCKDQLQNLEACQNRPYVLDNKTINRIIKLCNDEMELTPICLEQCHRWRKLNLTKQQIKDIDQLESNEKECLEINKNILYLASSYRKKWLSGSIAI